jgi:pectate lyase
MHRSPRIAERRPQSESPFSRPRRRAGLRRWPILTLLVHALILAGCDSPGSTDVASLEGISLVPAEAALDEGRTLQLQVMSGGGAVGPASAGGLSWSSSNPGVASVTNGLVTATGPGEATISAFSQGGSVARSTVRVTRTAEEIRILAGDGQESVVGLPLEQELQVKVLSGAGNPVAGARIQFSVVKGGGELSSVISTTDGQGVARSAWALGPIAGEQKVEVRSVHRADVGASFTALARPDRPDRVEMRPQGVTLQKGAQFTFEVVVQDRFGNVLGSPSVSWGSEDPTIATVDQEGRVRSVNTGETTISAAVQDAGLGLGGDLTGQLALAPGNGNGHAWGRVKVDDEEGEAEATLSILSGDGQTGVVGGRLAQDLEIFVVDAGGRPMRGQDVTWTVTSGGGSVVNAASKTDGRGRASAGWVLGTTVGAGTLDARVHGVGTATFHSSAIAGPLAVVQVLPESAKIKVDAEQSYDLLTADAYGNPVTPGSSPQWAVGNQEVATISSPGKAKGKAGGSTTVKASVSGVEGESTLMVEGSEDPGNGDGPGDGDSSTVSTVTVSPSSVTLVPGETRGLTATVLDGNGNKIEGKTVQWTSSNTSVVTVAGSGESATATAVASGSASIQATVDGVSGSTAVTVSSPVSSGLLPAFPGAEGWGATALNECRSLPLQVLFVTNTNTDGAGSFDQAIRDARSDRFTVIVFRTGGSIVMPSNGSRFNASCVYIAGQTAPGDGIAVQGQGASAIWFRGYGGNLSDVVMRYLRFRGRSGRTQNNLIIAKGERIVLDHMSFSWTDNYVLAILRASGDWSGPISDVIVQNSIISEAFAVHPTAFQISSTSDLRYEPSIDVTNVSVHRNLFAHNSHRNPSANNDNSLLANNVIYNWIYGTGRNTVRGTHDWVGNVAKRGPMTDSRYMYPVTANCNDDAWAAPPSMYVVGNVSPMNDDENGDNWAGPTRQVACFYTTGNVPGDEVPAEWRRHSPQSWGTVPFPVRILSASDAYSAVLNNVGANRRLTCDGRWEAASDPVDVRIISDARHGTGASQSPDSENEVGGYPTYRSGTPCPDADKDGLPDAWESRFFGCATCANPAAVGRNGYLVIEHYLNGTTP